MSYPESVRDNDFPTDVNTVSRGVRGGAPGGHFGLAAAEFWFRSTDLFVGLWVSLLEKGFHGSSKVCKADRLLFQKQVRGAAYRLKRTQKRSVTWQKGSRL